MDQAVNALALAILATLTFGVIALGLVFRARGEMAKDFQKAELKRQELADEERLQLNKSLEEFRTQFANERLARIERDQALAQMQAQRQAQDAAIAKLQQDAAESKRIIEALGKDNAALKGELDSLRTLTDKLREEVAIVQRERDEALQAVEKKNGELKEARATIERMEGVLQEQTREMSSIRERLAKLETKPDTGTLNPAVVPHTDPSLDGKATVAEGVSTPNADPAKPVEPPHADG